MDSEKTCCPVCSSLSCMETSTRSDLNLVECLNCSLVFRNPMPSAEQIKEFYQEGYYDYWKNAQEFDNIYKIKYLTAQNYLNQIREQRPNGKLLDIGCAYGYMLEAAKDVGFEPFGIELASEAVEHLRRQGHNVYDKALEELDLQEEQFDVITMIDLIEHIPKPLDFCHLIRRFLKKNGIVFIVTPNVSSFPASLLGKYWPHYQREHLCYYNKKAFSYLFNNAGLDLVAFDGAHKILNGNYIKSHFKHFGVGIPTKILCQIADLVPRPIAEWPIKLPTEVFVMARKI